MTERWWVGIDVSKATLVIGLWQEEGGKDLWDVPNEEASFQEVVERLRSVDPKRIVLEATGGWERGIAAALLGAGLPAVVVNPRLVKDYRKSLNQLAKTDRIDAIVLARFGYGTLPKLRPLPEPTMVDLQGKLARRRQLVEFLSSEKNRLVTAAPDSVLEIREHIQWLQQHIAAYDDQIGQLIEASPAWLAKASLLRSVKGIGPVISRTLIGDLPELGTVSKGQIAFLAGLAPLNCDSGESEGARHIKGGRAHVRTAIFMATRVALRHNPRLRLFYSRLLAKGKLPKVALIATMRKLLVTLNAMLRDGTSWCDRSALEA